MLKGAIMGFGQVAEQGHVPAFKARGGVFEITAVADSSESRRNAAAAHFPGAALYESYEEMLARERKLDFVDIATPPVCHVEHAAKALDKGVSVLCEKPLSFSAADAARLARQAADKELCLFTIHNWKKAPPIAKAAELIAQGVIGKVRHLELHVLRSQAAATASNIKNWRQDPAVSGGGIMVDHGWHNFYLACHLAGQQPRNISALLSYPSAKDAVKAESACSCHIEFEHATALVYLTWESPSRKNLILIYGTDGLIEIRDSVVILETRTPPAQTFETGEKLSGGSAHPTWMAGLLDDFAAEMKNPKERGGNMREALLCAGLLEAGYQSARDGATVALARPRIHAVSGGKK